MVHLKLLQQALPRFSCVAAKPEVLPPQVAAGTRYRTPHTKPGGRLLSTSEDIEY
jgi:hypothetical protein